MSTNKPFWHCRSICQLTLSKMPVGDFFFDKTLTEKCLQDISVVVSVLLSESTVHGVELAVVAVDSSIKSTFEFSDLGKTSVQAGFDTEKN